ncbi:MAG: molybdopterin molybdotransferase MoeA [Euryarchaeota archaeon]|nr:molybdopterin molybdotransferase MoeA [Euryarchaeota archaeon]
MQVRGRGFYRLTKLEDALERLLSGVKPLGEESVQLEEALDRVLASDIVAERDSPPFDRAAMDGFAVRGENTFGAGEGNPIYFKVVGEVLTGQRFNGEVGDFQAVKITTGAPMPPGTNAVVMLEHVNELGDEIEVLKAVPPGKNVSLRGEDYRKGELLLGRGRVLHPQEIAILASLGISRVRVLRRPRVGIISTGDEIVEPGEELGEGQVYDINSFALAALCRSAGAVPVRLGVVRDEYGEIRRAVEGALNLDVVLISGATSVGKRDVVPEVVRELGEVVVHGIAMRPGEPAGFGYAGDTLIFMLPGYPVASIVAFEALVRPALQKMQGMRAFVPYPAVRARLRRKIASELGRRDFVRVRLVSTDSGLEAEPIRTSGSGIVSSLVRGDGFVVVPENTEGVEKGEWVEVRLFRLEEFLSLFNTSPEK